MNVQEYYFDINMMPSKANPYPLDILDIDRNVAERILRALRARNMLIFVEEPPRHRDGFKPRYVSGKLRIWRLGKRLVVQGWVYGGNVWDGYVELLAIPEAPVAILNNIVDGRWAMDVIHDVILLSLTKNPCESAAWRLISPTDTYCQLFDN